MRRSVVFGLAALVVAAAYVAYPYFALHRLGTALESGDPAAIEPMVEWQALRQGFKDDLNAMVALEVAKSPKEETPFALLGAALARSMTDGLIDAFVTPQRIAAALRSGRPPKPGADKPAPPSAGKGDGAFQRPKVEQAFFEGPTSFRAVVRGKHTRPEEKGLEIRMGLVGVSWKLTRIHLPAEEIVGRTGK